MTEPRIRRLRPDDERSRFHSGDPDLDRYFQRCGRGRKTGAEAFYRRFAVESLETIKGELHERPGPKPMFLPISAIPAECGETGTTADEL